MKTDEHQLLAKINAAVAAANEADEVRNVAIAATHEASKRLSTARDELKSRNMTIGKLLLEAKKLHPVKRDFDAFLDRVVGLKKTRVQELMALAGGDITEEELKKNTRDRVNKHRAKKKRAKPELVSVTPTPVTVSDQGTEQQSTRALAEFTYACRQYLPKMTTADQHKARTVVSDALALERAPLRNSSAALLTERIARTPVNLFG